VRWAREHIQAGMAAGGRHSHRIAVYLDVKVQPNGKAARAAVRQALAKRLPWADIQLSVPGIANEVAAFLQMHNSVETAQDMPDKWVDAFSAAGTPEQVAQAIQHWSDAGADSIVFQPLNGDPACFDEYIHYLMPILKRNR
jgi:5,10-methylenetetrahydromethanopterin reductase